jgi:hypothetical protein
VWLLLPLWPLLSLFYPLVSSLAVITPSPLPDLNFTNVGEEKIFDSKNAFEKPLAIGPPETYREAKLSPWWPQYKLAAQAEYDGHVEAGTWKIIPREKVPFGKNILRGKWLFTDKRGEDGKVLKFKARFVAMGNTQKYGIDYEETFAGVVVSKSFRIMLSILNEASTHEMEHWDVKMAFTHAVLDEEIFMYQPEGYEKGDGICLLLKSLYGLKQAARNWQLLLKNYFLQNGFHATKADACVFFRIENLAFCIVSTHVDDIFALYSKEGKRFRDQLFESILADLPIENLGPISWALKTMILRDRASGILKISQEQYIREFLAKSSKNGQFPAMKSPVTNPNFQEKFEYDEKLDGVDENLKKQFQQDIGAFWWLAQVSRPDIYYAVHRCSKLVNKPNIRLGQRIQKIKNYLAATPTIGIIFQRKLESPTLSGFVDAAFAAEDGVTSRVGYFFLFRGNLVSWTSQNPTRVMTSSTEVECNGLVLVSKENLWHRQFQKELALFSVDSPTIIYEDNISSINLATSLSNPHNRSRHFGIEWSYFKESVELLEIVPVYVSTDEQAADIMTKSILSPKFIVFRDMVMGSGVLQDHFDKKLRVTHSVVRDLKGPRK